MKIRVLNVILMGMMGAVLGVGFLTGTIYFYPTQSSGKKADAAIVLGAAVWGDEPSPVFRERLNHAVELYKNQQVDKIILTGGSLVPEEPADSMIANNYVIKQGVFAGDIFIEIKSRTTFQNLYYAQQVAEREKLSSFLIVSDSFHLKRAVVMAEDLGMKVFPSATPTSVYRSWQTQLQFLSRETVFYGLYLAGRSFIPLEKRLSNF